MWSLRKRKQPPSETSETAAPHFSDIVGYGDLNDLYLNDAVLRVWLPWTAKTALEEVRRARGGTAAQWLREFFVTYLFGEHELLRMREHKTGLYFNPNAGIRYSVARQPPKAPSPYEVLRGLGKNIWPLKVYVPHRLKSGLDELGKQADMELSAFIRMLLISRLLGHQVWQRLPERDNVPSSMDVASSWENGELEPELCWPDKDAQSGASEGRITELK